MAQAACGALNDHVFWFRHTEHCYVYAPLQNILVEMTESGLAEMQAFVGDKTRPPSSAVDKLAWDLELFKERSELPENDLDATFAPEQAVLFLTNRCNLRCRYCYAAAGDAQVNRIDPRAAHAAIQLVVQNAAKSERKSVSVAFHGGGEPTLEWTLLTELVEYARKLAAGYGIRANLSIGTNGALPPDRARWLAAHLSSITISIDGIGSVHDGLRPTRDGTGSFQEVRRTAAIFAASAARFGVRCTVTSENIDHLGALVNFASSLRGCTRLKLEPVFPFGRCVADSSLSNFDALDFCDAFTGAAQQAKQGGNMEVTYSGVRSRTLTRSFCSAELGLLGLTPAGVVTSCFEVTGTDHPLAPILTIGRFDQEEGRFRFYPEAIRRLRATKERLFAGCRDCFCKYHCAGDCLVKRLTLPQAKSSPQPPDRCAITRELTKRELISRLELCCETAATTTDC